MLPTKLVSSKLGVINLSLFYCFLSNLEAVTDDDILYNDDPTKHILTNMKNSDIK